MSRRTLSIPSFDYYEARLIETKITSSSRQCGVSVTPSERIREHEATVDSTQADGLVHGHSFSQPQYFRRRCILRDEERNRDKCRRKSGRTGGGHRRAYGT